MRIVSIILVLLILTVWVVGAISLLRSSTKKDRRTRLLETIAPIFMIVGSLGFFGTTLSALGALNWLPPSFEWPVGFTKGAAMVGDKFYAVPHTPSSRLQIYDSNWRFLRGWHLDAGAGAFMVNAFGADRVEVVTARGKWRYVFDLNGALLLKETYAPASYGSFKHEGISRMVPTNPWLLIFSRPFYSWLSGAAGIGLLITAGKLKARNGGISKSRS
jgi:hypothetical protein